nr:uncharacterized protein LOC126055408 [Helicoverpa armigera]
MRKFIERLLRSSGKLRRVARGKRRSRRPQVCPPPHAAPRLPTRRARHSFLSSATAASRLSTTEASDRPAHAQTAKRRANCKHDALSEQCFRSRLNLNSAKHFASSVVLCQTSGCFHTLMDRETTGLQAPNAAVISSVMCEPAHGYFYM